jgi:hypothetical protein
VARVYSALCLVGNRTTANTDDCYIEISVPVNTTIRIRRIKIQDSGGTSTALFDGAMRVKLQQTSTTMADGSAFTPVKQDPKTAASACTVKTKTASTSVATPGTLTTLFEQYSLRSEHYFDYSAHDKKADAITIIGAAFFEIVLSVPSATARNRHVHVVWEEF